LSTWSGDRELPASHIGITGSQTRLSQIFATALPISRIQAAERADLSDLPSALSIPSPTPDRLLVELQCALITATPSPTPLTMSTVVRTPLIHAAMDVLHAGRAEQISAKARMAYRAVADDIDERGLAGPQCTFEGRAKLLRSLNVLTVTIH
jgi:hypothetical protein